MATALTGVGQIAPKDVRAAAVQAFDAIEQLHHDGVLWLGVVHDPADEVTVPEPFHDPLLPNGIPRMARGNGPNCS